MGQTLQLVPKYWRDCCAVRTEALILMLMWFLLVTQKRLSGCGINYLKNLGGSYGITLSFVGQ